MLLLSLERLSDWRRCDAMADRKVPPGTRISFLMKVGAWWGEAYMPGEGVIFVGPCVVRHDAEVELSKELEKFREGK